MSDAAEVLARPVYATDGYKPFGEFTVSDVEARAAELSAASGFGPTARVGSVAREWSALAAAMRSAGAACVADLASESVLEYARKVWVVPPGGSLL